MRHDPTCIPSKSEWITDKIQNKDEYNDRQREEEYFCIG